MLKKRLIPILLMREGILVQSIQFRRYLPVGNPKIAIDYFNSWEVDEIIFLDISPGHTYKQGRLDINLANFESLIEYTKYISTKCFVPLTVGGGIQSVNDIQKLLHAGADKVSINTAAVTNPSFVTTVAKKFGRQCIVVSIDVKKTSTGYQVVTNRGKKQTNMDPLMWARKVVSLGAGEILVQSIDRDGTKMGYDIELIKMIADGVDAPVIAASGVGEWQHLVQGIHAGHASAVAAGNIFHYTEHSTKHAKNALRHAGIDVR